MQYNYVKYASIYKYTEILYLVIKMDCGMIGMNE